MSLRAVKHKFTGLTTPISAYDETKTNLGSLIFQKTGTNTEDKYISPLPVSVTLPMQEVVHTGNVATVSATVVTGSGTSFTASMTGMLIGFGSTDPAKVTTWYTLGAYTSATIIAITSGPTIGSTTPFVIVSNIPSMYPHAITYSSTIDWVFMVENLATASTPRRIMFYEFNKTTAVYAWKGFINATLLSGANANTIRGFRALRYLHTSGTASMTNTSVTGTGTTWQKEKIALGARIGFGSTDPTAISTWYVISAIGSDTGITLASSSDSVGDGPYVIEELRFVLTVTQATAPANGGLFLVKGVNYSDFLPTGTTISAATSTDNQRGVYWLCDAGSTGNALTNQTACGCAIAPEVNKGLHYAYVIDGSTNAKIYRYNLRATGTVTSGKMLLSIAYTTSGTVTVSSGVVTASGTPFTAAMVGMKIGFGSTSPALITTWYTIGTYTGTNSVTLTNLTVNVGAGASYIVDSADLICTGNVVVPGTLSAVNNGRIGTLNHGPGAGVESLYFVTTTRICRAAMSNIYNGNLDWISDSRIEIPPGSASTFAATAALNVIEIADYIDRLIVLTTGAGAIKHYVTRYPAISGDQFDRFFGVDDKQQDQILALGSAYITSGTVTVPTSTTVTGVGTFFTSAMVGFRIGFGSTDPTAISTWYTITSWTSFTSITIDTSATVSGGSAYVIDWNSKTVPHYNTGSQVSSVWSQNGIAHIVRHGTTATLCQMYSLPFGTHATFTDSTDQKVITPSLYTPNCKQFKRVFVNCVKYPGSGEFSLSPEHFVLYFRTKGIKYDNGDWTLVPKDGNLSGLSGYSKIQFMIKFNTIGQTCIPAKIMGLTVVYDDEVTTTDSHYQPSASKSNPSNKEFAWRFATAFGSTVPTLRVRLYEAISGDLLVDDYTVNPKGTWEKSLDGSSWSSYDTSDKGVNQTTYIRYTPASLGDNIKVRAVLTQ
jgi:hypothetical protein